MILEKTKQQAPLSKELRSQPLEVLNQQAIKNHFSLEDVPWEQTIDHSQPWMPDSLLYTSYLPSYQKLSAEYRLKFNQLTALAICEQFIWLEEELLCPILTRVLKTRAMSDELRECLETFVIEEKKHSEMFRRTLQKAKPEIYANKDHHLYELKPLQKSFFDLMVKYPNQFLTWIWLAIFFEEKTLLISLHYAREKTQPVDEFFQKIHHLHLLDESRHLQIDQYLLMEFYDSESVFKRRISAHLFDQVLKAFTAPKRTSYRIIEELWSETSAEDRQTLSVLKSELPFLGDNSAFKKTMFGEKSMSRTRKLMSQYPEHQPGLRHLKA